MQKKRYERLGARYGWMVLLVFVLLVLVSGGIVLFSMGAKADVSRLTVLSVGDPMVIWSRDPAGRGFIKITIPAAVQVDAVGGYGRYSLNALWKLGEMDKKSAALVQKSLEEAFGVPIPWYLDTSGQRFLPRTNMPITMLLIWLWNTRSIRPDQMKEIVMNRQTGLMETAQPDGVGVEVLDPDRIDTALGSLFEDEAIRREHLSATVYNTTEMPTLGKRVGRLLNRMGIFVVRVGNDTPRVDQCVVSGEQSVLQSVTARVVAAALDCQLVVKPSDAGDLEIRVGLRYEKRFLSSP